jgi:alkylated DNA repair protein alkB family protein 1
MNYDWTNRTYVEGWKSEFPRELADLCISLAKQAGYQDDYHPEAAIVNFYTPSQIMGPHRDDAELTMKKPIVSISLGCDAVFCIENKPFSVDSEVGCVWVRSGDVVIMAGDSRRALHGIACTIPGTFRGDLPKTNNVDTQNLKLVRLLARTRININVRQVEDWQDTEAATFRGRGVTRSEKHSTETQVDKLIDVEDHKRIKSSCQPRIFEESGHYS